MRKAIWAALAAFIFGFGVSAQEPLKIFVNGALATRTYVGTYSAPFDVTMSGFAGGHIYVTTNGAVPTVASLEYTNRLRFTTNVTVRALAYDATFSQSRTGLVNIALLPLYQLYVSGALQRAQYSIDGAEYLPIPGNRTINVGVGQLISLRAIEGNGWNIDGWKGAHSFAGATNSFYLERSQEIRLSMINTNELIVPKIGDGAVIVDPPPPYYWEDSAQLTAMPNDGSFFAGWNLPANSPKGSSIAIPVLSDPPTATFSTLPGGSFPVTVQIEGQGAVVAPTRFFGLAGEVVNTLVAPAPGWYVSHWSGDVSGPGTNQASPYGNGISATVDTNKVLTAHLRKIIRWTATTIDSPISMSIQGVAPNGLVALQRAGFDYGSAWMSGLDQDGVMRWDVFTPYSDQFLNGSLIGPNGTIFQFAVGRFGAGFINGISQEGELLFRTTAPRQSVSAAVSEKGLYMATDTSPSNLRRLALDGTMIRFVSAGPYSWVALDSNSNPITTGAAMISTEPDLDFRWSKGGTAAERVLIDANNNIITADLTKLSGSTGAAMWTNAYSQGRPVCLGTNRVFIIDTGDGGKLSALDLATGQKLWTAPEPYAGVGLKYAVAAEDGTIFATFSDKYLRKISPDGSILWESLVGAGSPILTREGDLYIGITKYNVGVGPAPSGYPMAGADWRRSNRAYTGSVPVMNEITVSSSGGAHSLVFYPVTAGDLMLQWSSDLENWHDLQSFSGPLNYTISEIETLRFYRIIQL